MLFADYGSCRRSSTQEVELQTIFQAIRYVVLHSLLSALFVIDCQFLAQWFHTDSLLAFLADFCWIL